MTWNSKGNTKAFGHFQRSVRQFYNGSFSRWTSQAKSQRWISFAYFWCAPTHAHLHLTPLPYSQGGNKSFFPLLLFLSLSPPLIFDSPLTESNIPRGIWQRSTELSKILARKVDGNVQKQSQTRHGIKTFATTFHTIILGNSLLCFGMQSTKPCMGRTWQKSL